MTDGLTCREAAERLHVHVRTVHRMIARGQLHPIDKVPGYRGDYRLDEHEVDELAEAEAEPEERERAS